jgi:hypothetical protein
MMRTALLVLFLAGLVQASDVEWTRFKGKVKNVNQKASKVTIQNGEGDLITVKVSGDVQIMDGKDVIPLGQVGMDSKVTLIYAPKPDAPKEETENFGSTLPPVKR